MLYHQPILLSEVLEFLKPASGKTYLDCTLGNGGHTLALLEAGAKVIAFEQDPDNIKIVQDRINNPNLTIINDNFSNLNKHLSTLFDGILFDLGLSINQQKAVNRGFSFNDELSLDMRLDPNNQTLTAQEIINTFNQEELFEIFSKNAQEKNSRQIARLITQHRPFKTALQLATIIRKNYPQNSKIDPATKVFMALRIYVNNEFENLKNALEQTLSLIKPNAPVCIISFHSGEDRIVKNFIRSHQLQSTMILPSQAEIKKNPLSRSAVLRSYKID